MTLLEMGFAGSIMILAVLLLRRLLFDRLPKRVLPVLWALVLCRLLVPFSWPAALTYPVPAAPAETGQIGEKGGTGQAGFGWPAAPAHLPRAGAPERAAGEGRAQAGPALWQIAWAAGSLGLALSFAWRCRKARRVFREAVPAENQAARQWLAGHPLRRPVALRQTDRIDSPLTYGLLRPVILLPASMDCAGWQAGQLEAALAHEWTHIRRLDGLTKLLLAAALCLHWWNPLVWLFYRLHNRDLELACDEGAIRLLGLPRKKAYARALVELEQARQAPPFCSPFSKSPLETRVRAIVKMKKPTWHAWLMAGLCLLALTLCFGSAKGQKETEEGQAPLTAGQRQMLEALEYPGYQQMTVEEFRRKAGAQIDGQGWEGMIDDLWLDEEICRYQDSDRQVEFLCHTLVPLTAGYWQQSFSGGVDSDLPDTQENAGLEYVVTLTITDEKALTVHRYRQAQIEVPAALDRLLEGKTPEQLGEEQQMRQLIEAEISRLQTAYGGDGLEILVEYQYQPPAPGQDMLEDRRQQWQQVLAPYLPFGVAFQYDQGTDSFRLYFQGEEIRGIYDTEQGIWITEHTGDSFYPQGAPELYAVYQDGRLTGLRRATEQEQREFDRLRYQNAQQGRRMAEELRQYPPGTEQDYQSLFALRQPDYRRQTLARFNRRLLDWANQDEDRYQRVMTDIGSGDFRVALTPEQRQFVQLTCDLSAEENFRQIQSGQRGQPALDPQYGGLELAKEQDRAQVDLRLEFTYHVEDPEALTVGQRDDQVGGFLRDVQDFWQQQTLNDLAQYTRGRMLDRLKSLAAGRSGNGLEIRMEEDLIGFEMVKWTE